MWEAFSTHVPACSQTAMIDSVEAWLRSSWPGYQAFWLSVLSGFSTLRG